MGTQTDPALPARRGFVVGELLVAILLLALAISSVSALMYTVTRHPRSTTAAECTDKEREDSPRCSPKTKRASTSGATVSKATAQRLLVAGCATRTRDQIQPCRDSVNGLDSNGTTIRSRTDSASLQLLPKKPKRISRPDLGFVR